MTNEKGLLAEMIKLYDASCEYHENKWFKNLKPDDSLV